jgi:casein kinase 1
MKLNNGKGWEAMKHHSSQHLHAANAGANPTTRALAGGADTPRGTGTQGVSAIRLNAAQPLPPSPAKPGVGKTRDRPGVAGAQLPKRSSGVVGGLNDVTPTVSTQGQFQSSTANLPQRMSQANPAMNPLTAGQQGSRIHNPEIQPSALQKIMRVLCCSR